MIQFQSMQQDILFFLLEKQIDFFEREEQKNLNQHFPFLCLKKLKHM